MIKNLYSLGLLRNGKVYSNKELAYQGLTQSATNDGVAKLARYLVPVVGGDPIIRTLVGFYANAAEMEDAGGGQSSYTILDIEGSAAEVEEIKEQLSAINETIGDGIAGTTLTDAINDINDKIGSGFSENYTVADALEALEEELTEKLTISLESSEDDPDYAKVYTLKQGGVTVGTINIPKDIVVKEGKLVYGAWDGDEFHENNQFLLPVNFSFKEGFPAICKYRFRHRESIFFQVSHNGCRLSCCIRKSRSNNLKQIHRPSIGNICSGAAFS